MAHEIAKLVLEHAESVIDRSEAIKTALGMGMPLNEIEEYLDWLALVRSQKQAARKSSKTPPGDTESS